MTAQALIEKIQQLPPERLGEVVDFVDFLALDKSTFTERP